MARASTVLRMVLAAGGLVSWRCPSCLAVREVHFESLSHHAPACPCALTMERE